MSGFQFGENPLTSMDNEAIAELMSFIFNRSIYDVGALSLFRRKPGKAQKRKVIRQVVRLDFLRGICLPTQGEMMRQYDHTELEMPMVNHTPWIDIQGNKQNRYTRYVMREEVITITQH